MKITEREVGDITVLDIDGNIELGEGDILLRDHIRWLIERKRIKVIINCTHIPYMDSGGLGEIVRSFTTISNAGGELVLLNIAKRVKDLLTITKLTAVFQIFEDEAKAIAYFKSWAPGLALTIHGSKDGDVLVFTCEAIVRTPEITNADLTALLLQAAEEHGPCKILIDTSDAAYNSKWLVRHLRRMKIATKLQTCTIKLVTSEEVRSILAAEEVLEYFPVHLTAFDALVSFPRP